MEPIRFGPSRRDTPETVEEKIGTITKSVKSILEAVGEDPEREGLARTPERYAKAMLFFTKGYTQSLKGIKLLLVAACHG